MTDIKFRQLLKQGFEYFGFIEMLGNEVWVSPPNVNRDAFPVDQYTGRKDIDGIEMYHNDIVHFEQDGVDFIFLISKTENGCFVAHFKEDIGDFYFLDDYNYKVIGNIHQNPELLIGE